MNLTTRGSPAADILVVDDTPINLHLLTGVLQDRGYSVRPVSSGEAALQAARAAAPDLVLLDIDMPGMDGFQICEHLKADPTLADVPVIFISALTEVLDKVRAFSLGGIDYITKPFQAEEVHARVATHLELRRQRRELQQSYDRLQELERLRDGLVHMVIHDLRSPLTALVGYLELLELEAGGALSPTARSNLRRARDASGKMIGLVGSVLDVSRMEEGKLTPELHACDMGDLARQVTDSLRSLARDRSLSVERTPQPVMALADRDLVSRVLENLLSNALKLTPPGGAVRVGVERRDDEVEIAVHDDGPGVPPELRERIFDKFAQVEARARGSRFPSSGLGLTFCKLAVEAHGGRIGAESKEGGGSRFWFTLPAAWPALTPEAARADRRASPRAGSWGP